MSNTKRALVISGAMMSLGVCSLAQAELLGVQVEMPSNSPLMLLKETAAPGRVLPVVIDTPEAQAIYRGIERIRMARPLTHDLMKILLDEVGATVTRVTVTELRERTFFAEIEMDVGGTTHVVSARPSDAVALAVRTETPIFATEEVLAEGSAAVLVERHELRPTTGTTDGWVDRKLVLRTRPETEALLLVALLGLPTPVRAGTVDFTDLLTMLQAWGPCDA